MYIQEKYAEYVGEESVKALNIYYCGSEQCAPSHAFGPAVRAHYLLHFVFKGKGKYICKDEIYELQEGDAFLIFPGITTYYEADEANPWEYAWIAFDGYEVKHILKKCGFTESSLIYRGRENIELLKRVEQLIEIFPESGQNEYELLGCLFLIFSCMSEPRNHDTKSYTKEYLSKALEYIHHNYSYDIKVSNIAKYIGIDRTYLYKIFMEDMNCSPQKYLIETRLKAAEDMLKFTDLNITEVANSNGFKDTPSFCKKFSAKYNISPLQFRKTAVKSI